MEYYSELRQNQPWKKWRNIKCILLSERSQSEKATECVIFQMHDVQGKAKLYSQRKNGGQGIGSRKEWMDDTQRVLGHWKYAL